MTSIIDLFVVLSKIVYLCIYVFFNILLVFSIWVFWLFVNFFESINFASFKVNCIDKKNTYIYILLVFHYVNVNNPLIVNIEKHSWYAIYVTNYERLW